MSSYLVGESILDGYFSFGDISNDEIKAPSLVLLDSNTPVTCTPVDTNANLIASGLQDTNWTPQFTASQVEQQVHSHNPFTVPLPPMTLPKPVHLPNAATLEHDAAQGLTLTEYQELMECLSHMTHPSSPLCNAAFSKALFDVVTPPFWIDLFSAVQSIQASQQCQQQVPPSFAHINPAMTVSPPSALNVPPLSLSPDSSCASTPLSLDQITLDPSLSNSLPITFPNTFPKAPPVFPINQGFANNATCPGSTPGPSQSRSSTNKKGTKSKTQHHSTGPKARTMHYRQKRITEAEAYILAPSEFTADSLGHYICPVPECGYVQKNERLAEFKRHFAGHYKKSVPCTFDSLLLNSPAGEMRQRICPEAEVFVHNKQTYIGGCGKTFAREDALKRHVRQAHTGPGNMQSA